ncbi:MAG: hypothetical protein ABIJ97_11085, partial [Bacteroidota bacterium]
MNKLVNRAFLIVIIAFFLPVFQNTCLLYGQNDGVIDKDKENYTIKMASAWLKVLDEDYYGALRIYRTIFAVNPEDAMLNFRMGQCFVEIKEMDTALVHLKRSLQNDSLINTDVYLALGQAYQYLTDIDNAIENYYRFKVTLSPKKNDRHVVNTYMRECYTAKDLIANPVNVQIKNLGEGINSIFTDANPSITADGQTMVFTSRRPDNTGGNIDPYVEEYYDDIYISTWDAGSKVWTKAVNIGSPVNSDGHDANMSISPDGKELFTYKNLMGETRSGDIYICEKKPTGEWGEPKAIINKYVNTTYFESSACLSGDGKTLYFVSEREREGFGHGDIYYSIKDGKEWTKPVNLGPVINTEGDEIGVFIHPDGKSLFFSSNGHNTMGGYDIFMSVFENERWSEPINMGYPINTTRDEIHLVFSTDRKTAYISSSREGGKGKMDIYQVNMAYYFKNNQNISSDIASTITGPPLSILKGTVVDGETSQPIEANIIIKDLSDNKTKITSSNENGEYFITIPADVKYEITIKNK